MKSTLYATREYLNRHLSHIVMFAVSAAIVMVVSLAFTSVASAQTYSSSSSTSSTPSTSTSSPSSTSSTPSTSTPSTSNSSTSATSLQTGSLTGTLDFGARGSNVTSLQTFLASNPSFYPEGLITGYYGSLTRAAVQRLQVFYGIVSSGTVATTGYGRVGPTTLAKINSLMTGGTGGGTTGTDTIAPSIFNATSTRSTNSTTFSFTTNEPVTARVVYGTNPLMFNEGNENGVGFGPIGGTSVSSPSGMSTSHTITVPNLNTNTNYYFTIIVTDAAGNVSVWGPNNALRTNQ